MARSPITAYRELPAVSTPRKDGPNATTTQTAGIMVDAPAGPVTGTIIQGNTVSGDYYGIYLQAGASGSTVSGNTITVTKGGVPIFTVAAPGSAYWQAGSDGGVFSFGGAPFLGSKAGQHLNAPVVGMVSQLTPGSCQGLPPGGC